MMVFWAGWQVFFRTLILISFTGSFCFFFFLLLLFLFSPKSSSNSSQKPHRSPTLMEKVVSIVDVFCSSRTPVCCCFRKKHSTVTTNSGIDIVYSKTPTKKYTEEHNIRKIERKQAVPITGRRIITRVRLHAKTSNPFLIRWQERMDS